MSARRLADRVGHRGVCLLFLWVLDWVYALSLANPLPGTRQSPSIELIGDIMPLSVWAALWFVVGTGCLVGAFMQRDQLAFSGAMFVKVLWGTVYTVGWAVAGLPRGWLGGVVWLSFAFLVFVISTWPEPLPPLDPPLSEEVPE